MKNLSVVFVALVMSGSALPLACGDGATENPGAGGGANAGSGGGSESPGAAASSAEGGTGGDGGAGAESGANGGAGAESGASSEAGGAGSEGGGPNPSFGIVSCQPAFEVACKPPIEFVNGDPNGRGKVFTNAIPDVQATLKDIACTVCSILYREPSELPQDKRPSKIRLVLDDHGGVAQAGGDQIQFDLEYISGWADRPADEIKQEMLGVLQHETVHLYQNYGNGGTGEGLADVVRTRVGYYQRSRWQPGGSWRDAYTNSAFFYSWLTGPCSFHSEHYSMHDLDLPYKLNRALAGQSDEAAYDAVDQLLQRTFGKSADALWAEYQESAF